MKKILLSILTVIFILEPFLAIADVTFAQAESASSITDESDPALNPDGTRDDAIPDGETSSTESIDPFNSLDDIERSFVEENTTSLSMEDRLIFSNTPKIILNADDADAIRSLSCLYDLMPDYANDAVKLFAALPKNSRPRTADDLSSLKSKDSGKYFDYVSQAQKLWDQNNQDLILNDNDTLACISGLSTNEITDLRKEDSDRLKEIVNDSKEGLTIDIRVLKTLIYLVTPKDQGGAGHYRIKVSRIRTGYASKNRELSRESDAIISTNNKNSGATSQTETNSENLDGKTAADIGMSRGTTAGTGYNIDGGTAMAVVEDQNGDEYDAYLNQQTSNEDQVLKGLNSDSKDERNVSAHAEGKAIDISEIDDIRCTLIKKRRLGGNKKTKSSVTPIKLAWQTQEGYDDSGGNTAGDLGTLFKQEAGDKIRDMVAELGGDLSSYDGDLANGNFSNIIQLIGNSLFTQVLNSPSANLSGYDFQDTLQKIGSIYFADFLGLPKEIFFDRKVSSLDDLQRIIGQSAIEKRLNLPYGTFNGTNLDETLLNIGQRKIEYEMGLNVGDLQGFSSGITPNIPLQVGQAVIEKALSLEDGSFNGKNFSELKNNIGQYKGQMTFLDLNYIDNLLHLDTGTAEKLKSDRLSPTAFTILVGRARLDDTAYGLKYFAAHDSEYNLSEGTWESALLGKKDALRAIGVDTITKAFASSDQEKIDMQAWLISNTAKSTPDQCALPSDTTVIPEDKALEIGLKTGDFYKMFACSKSNPGDVFQSIGSKLLYYAIVNYGLNPDEKLKIDLSETNPEGKILEVTKVDFYLSRIKEINDIAKRVKGNWEKDQTQIDYQYIADTLNHIIQIMSDPAYQLNRDSAKDASRRVAVEVGALKASFEGKRDEYAEQINKINATLIDLTRMSTLISEIFQGGTLKSTDTIQMSQIPENVFTAADAMYSNYKTVSSKYKSTLAKINKVSVMLLLARKVSPKDFFISMGIDKAETELNLPPNSINYYVQNTEKKGMSGKDAFYEAIGQAVIEQEFGMPQFYFQGPLYKIADKPDFKNDINSLLKFNGIAESDNLYKSTRNYILNSETASPEIYNYYVLQAENKYNEGLKKFTDEASVKGSDRSLDDSLQDVVNNVSANKLADSIRSPESDILFRMGLSGNLSSLSNGSALAWSAVNGRALEIDKKFFLKPGTTKSLFTGNLVPMSNGRDILGTNEKKLLAAKLGISSSAIDQYLKVLNGDLKPEALSEEGQEIFYNGSNAYAQKDESAATDDTCPNPLIVNDKGISISKEFLNDSFGVMTGDGLVFTKSSQAAQEIKSNSSQKIDFLTELSIGFAKATGGNADSVKKALSSYLADSKKSSAFGFTDQDYARMEQSVGIPVETLQKLFVRQNATLINQPLKAYKRAVGQAQAKRLISDKLFSSLGVKIDNGIFNSDTLYDVMNGNYEALYQIGGSMIDNSLNLPSGTVLAILNAKRPEFKKCMMAEAGGNILGNLVGLDYVSLQGNLLSNFGESKIEQTLNLPRNTFRGKTIDELVNNVSPINFALSFKIPLSGVITDDILSGIFGNGAKSAGSLSDGDLAKKIGNLANSNSIITSSGKTALASLNDKLRSRIKQILDPNAPHWSGNYKVADGHKDYEQEIKDFLDFVVFLDSTFGLSPGTTKTMLKGIAAANGKIITPDDYRDLVAKKTINDIASQKVLEMLGLNEYKIEEAKDMIKNFGKMVDEKRYGDIYTAMSEVFKVDLDSKAGFSEGTFETVLNDPKNASKVLLAEGIKEIDGRLGLDPDSDKSLSGLYAIYKSTVAECEGSLTSAEEEMALSDQEIQANSAANVVSNVPANDQNALISAKRSSSNEAYSTCKKEAISRIVGNTLETARDNVSNKIADKISEITKNTIDMPITDIKELIAHGDMRYFTTATLAYAANTVVNGSGESQSVPAGMRISYDDVKLAVFGDKGAEDAAIQSAVYADVTGTSVDAEASLSDFRYGDVCPGGSSVLSGALKCLSSDAYLAINNKTETAPRAESDLIASNKEYTKNYFRFDPNNNAITTDAALLYDNKYGSQIQIAESDTCKQNPNSASCQKAFAAVGELNDIKKEAKKASRQAFQEELQFRATDAMLWKLDKNIFPGFAYAMMKGSAQMREYALATYIRSGIIRGEFLGVDIGFKVPRVDQWIKAYNYFKDPSAPGALNNFYSNGGYDFVSGFVTSHSKDWLGFELPPDMFGSLLVGASTGAWKNSQATGGSFDSNGQYVIKDQQGKTVKTLPTLEQAGKNFVTSKIFAWADKTLGFPVGSSYQIYTAYRNMMEARSAYQAIKAVKAGKEIADAAKAAKAADDIQKAGGSAEVAESASAQNYQAAKAAVIAIVINLVFSKQIAAAEESLGLVPGTGAMLVTMITTWVMTGHVDPISIAIFVLFNLFGVYKVELKCSADGYYPSIESKPSSAKRDVTDLGVWNGMNPKTMQAKSIAAAQYKARRLIGDVLEMQKTPAFKDIIPSQVMTGRQEDVTFWDALISADICSKLGNKSIKGVCGGNTRAGVWQNPQTVALTHIGF